MTEVMKLKTLALGRKAMTNLHSVLKKNTETSLCWQGSLVKSTVFSVVVYRCEIWTIKKTEHWRTDASNCGLEKNLESPLESKIKSINPEYSLEDLMLKLKLQYFSHMMWRADSLEKTLMLGKIEGNRKRGWWESGWDHQLNGHEFEQIQGDSEGQVRLACYSPWGRKEWDMTERQNSNNKVETDGVEPRTPDWQSIINRGWNTLLMIKVSQNWKGPKWSYHLVQGLAEPFTTETGFSWDLACGPSGHSLTIPL